MINKLWKYYRSAQNAHHNQHISMKLDFHSWVILKVTVLPREATTSTAPAGSPTVESSETSLTSPSCEQRETPAPLLEPTEAASAPGRLPALDIMELEDMELAPDPLS